MSIRGNVLAGLCVLGLSAATACEDKKAAKPAEGGDSGAPKAASHGDKSIVEALQAEGSAMAQQGPPETGVFPPGGADRELKVGDPPKFSLGLKGQDPKVQLMPPPAKPAKKLEGKIEVSVQTGPRSAMPTVELTLVADPSDKPADPATAAPAVNEFIVKTMSSKLGADQPGQLPPGADKLIAKARGSRFTIQVLPGGSGKVTSVEPSKELDESLALVVRAASDAFTFAFGQYPTEPVGKDAFWMVTTREQYAGLDAVVYRMYKVVEAKPDHVMLDVQVKRLVSPGQLAMPGIPPHHVEQFNDTVTGRVEVLPSDTSNIHADLTDTIIAGLTPEGAAAAQAQGQHMGIQMQIKTRVALGR